MTANTDARMKLCTDCKWREAGFDEAGEFAKCRAPAAVPSSSRRAGITTGYAQWVYCSIERSMWWPFSLLLRTCGASGRYFEPKDGAP